MKHEIVVEKWEGVTDTYPGYKYTLAEILVDEGSETGWPDAVGEAKAIVRGHELIDKHNLRKAENEATDVRVGTDSNVYKCYSRKTEPIAI